MASGQQRRRSTHERIALKAGGSASTVDRVLNDRGHVSPGRYQRAADPELALHAHFRPPELRILCRENI